MPPVLNQAIKLAHEYDPVRRVRHKAGTVETLICFYNFAEFPHVIDVLLPFMCTYLPTWWGQGPDNADPPPSGSHVTMVTSDHLNSLLRLILKVWQSVQMSLLLRDTLWTRRPDDMSL